MSLAPKGSDSHAQLVDASLDHVAARDGYSSLPSRSAHPREDAKQFPIHTPFEAVDLLRCLRGARLHQTLGLPQLHGDGVLEPRIDGLGPAERAFERREELALGPRGSAGWGGDALTAGAPVRGARVTVVAVSVPLAPTVTESGLGVSDVGLGRFGVAKTVTVITVLALPAT